MRPPLNHEGQLMLPMIAALFLFCVFWLLFVGWIRSVYWRMRMDVASDLTAISAARQEASQLNAIAAMETLENVYLPKISVSSYNVSVMQLSMANGFMAINRSLTMMTNKNVFTGEILAVAQAVAYANGANRPAIPLSNSGVPIGTIDSELTPQGVHVFFIHGIIPAGGYYFPQAYFTRAWSPNKVKAQPDHRSNWIVCHGSVCGHGKAQLWLDVPSNSKLDDGGFPSANASLWRSVGIQCLYPQFNARLMRKQ